MVPAEVHDPLGRKIRAGFGLIDSGNTAVVEMADASGLRLRVVKSLIRCTQHVRHRRTDKMRAG